MEQIRRPEFTGKPVVIVHRSNHGSFVAAASPEARAQGVRVGMTSRHAGRYSPDATFLPADWEAGRSTSEKMLDILSRYTPLLQPDGIDRAYMDVTASANLFGDAKSIATQAQCEIAEAIQIQAKAGIASNKLVAYAAAVRCKPGGCIEISSDDEQIAMSPLPIRLLPGIGPKIGKRLANLGIKTAGEIANLPEDMLVRQFGAEGSRLRKLAMGVDCSPVLPLYPPDTIAGGHRFETGEESCEPEVAEGYLLRICDGASEVLSERRRKAGVVSLMIEFDDGECAGESYTPKSPVSSSHEIFHAASRILRRAMQGKEVRSIGILLSDLKPGDGVQLNMLDNSRNRVLLQSILSAIHTRFGPRAIKLGVRI
jgi:DNA polymerase-4